MNHPKKEKTNPYLIALDILNKAYAKSRHDDYHGAIEFCDELLNTPDFQLPEGAQAQRWLNKLRKLKQKVPDKKKYFEESLKNYQLNQAYMNSQKFSGATVFYPGTAFDFGSLSFFAQVEGIEKVVYADEIHWDIEEMRASIQKHLADFTITDFDYIRLDELFNVNIYRPWKELDKATKRKIWNAHQRMNVDTQTFYQNIMEKRDYDIIRPGFRFKLSKNGKTTNFTYYYDEGSLVYERLFEDGLDVKVLVLQNHGFVGPRFGGESELYTCLKEQGKLPDFLFVATELPTTPWPGYKPTAPPIYICRGQVHSYKKMIYRRVGDNEV